MKRSHFNQEVELKLLVPPGAMRRLGSDRLLNCRARPARKKLYSIYFDTPALDLWRRGIALRLRREGNQWVQAVKGGGTVHAGLHRRDELESEAAGPHPDFALIKDRALARVFASPRLRTQLKPVFVTEFDRVSRVIELHPGVTVEASLDSGEIRSGGRTETISEIELELKRGPAWRLHELALKLLERAPLAVGNRSKAERGYLLHRGERAAPVKAKPAALSVRMSVNEAFKAVLWASLGHLQANERGALAGEDPEYLHQMRVALRRLRSAFGVFSPPLARRVTAAAVKELKWLAGALAPARDWDVFMTETLPAVGRKFAGNAALAMLAKRCGRLRRSAARRVSGAIASTRYQRLVLSLAAWLAAEKWLAQTRGKEREALGEPVRRFASSVLGERYRRVRKRGRDLAQLSAAELHRLRIAVKKFRYATDFFEGLFESRKAREMHRQLARLQDILGAMNDAATAASLAGRGIRGAARERKLEARVMVRGWSRRRAATLRRELEGAWKAFRAAEKFW